MTLRPLYSPSLFRRRDRGSGAAAVPIDNKIEQAMDLVKIHLMVAVREEVEVLKEQIKDLVEKNSQLEQENSLLKQLFSSESCTQSLASPVVTPSVKGIDHTLHLQRDTAPSHQLQKYQ
ncbi:TSC22 domain family protein 1-like [Callorhinchus milii]|uniref:TSC22 domain family protein 1-like n=1 Tax=Callorhinchus milii TaxID=7868 RepID=UPI0004573DF6|nr:TSC22 domain family protein 1-like [Callorhinchus milii]|eukprot:gi/632985916/ref/XP_007909948.1/ PREDICTED: TSC22 domain family protein 1-like [Callorhinchus milii]